MRVHHIKIYNHYLLFALVIFVPFAHVVAQSQEDFLRAKELFEAGNLANSHGDFTGAIEKYTDAIAVYPLIPELYFNRAIAYRNLGNYAQSSRDFERLLQLDPKLPLPMWAAVYDAWGTVLQENGEYEVSLDRLNKAITLNPEHPNYYNARGNTYFFLKRHDEALQDYNTSIGLKPQSLPFYNRARLFTELGLLEKAINDYTEAIKLDPKYSESFNNRGLIFQRRGKLNLALKDFHTAISIADDDGVYYFNRANIYFEKQQFAAAVKDYTKAIEVFPKWALAYQRRAAAYKKLGRAKLAEADSLRSKELGKENFNPVKKTFIDR